MTSTVRADRAADADPAPAASTRAAAARSRDGRSTRWEGHRRERRTALVDAALRAIARLGPGVGMDDIAAEAGTSKTVLYRHFADKGQLYLAVAARVDQRVVRALRRATLASSTSHEALAAVISTYLELVEADPQVYRFVVQRSGAEGLRERDPVTGLSDAISSELARLIAFQLRDTDLDARTAAPWAHGLVGLVRAAADHWMSQADRIPADVLATSLTRLAWGGLSAVLDHPNAGPYPLAPLEEEHA